MVLRKCNKCAARPKKNNDNSDIKLNLKTVILYPIIKREYSSLLTGVFRKISMDAEQAKENFCS